MVVLFPRPATTPLPFSFQAEWNCLFPFHSKLNGLVSSFLFQAEWNCLSPFHSKAALVKFGPQELSRSNLSQADSGRLKWCLTIPLFNTSWMELPFPFSCQAGGFDPGLGKTVAKYQWQMKARLWSGLTQTGSKSTFIWNLLSWEPGAFKCEPGGSNLILLSNPSCPNSCMWPLQFASWIVILSDSDWIRINLQIKWAPFLRLLLHFHHNLSYNQ